MLNWDFWTFAKALTTFRISAIQHGVYSRALAGNAGSTKALMAGDTIVYQMAEATALLDDMERMTPKL